MMSVLAPVISSIDPVARRIYLLPGTTAYHPLDDVYAEVRDLRRNDETLRHYDMFVFAGGNIPKNAVGDIRTPRYAIFNNCKVVPWDADHDLNVTGEQLFADAAGDVVGSGKDCVDKTPLSPGTDVNIDYEPPGSEVIYVTTTGSALTPQESSDLSDIRKTAMNTRRTNPDTGEEEILNDADTAVEFIAPLWEDYAETQPYRKRGAEVRRKRTPV